MIVGVPKETLPGETRVALVPSAVAKLAATGIEVHVERNAGTAAFYPDAAYEEAGARAGAPAADVLSSADIVLKVRPPQPHPELERHEAELLREGAALVSFLFPLEHLDAVRRLRDRRVTSFAVELMPRITRAQSMDALSAMSSVAGYKAVLVAANLLPRFFPLLMTAAGTITPARVLILGAGVAGLQAIATARRLGAVVEAFDVRPVVKEQVESLGARFVEIPLEPGNAQEAGGYAREQSDEVQARIRNRLGEHVARADVVITTALVPGKRAPLLVTREMVEAMRAGSVLVDLAAEQGGNCELTVAGRTIFHKGVTVAGPANLPASLPVHASDMYSRNVSAYLLHLVKDGGLRLDLEDELVNVPLVTRDGEVANEQVRRALAAKSNQEALASGEKPDV